MKEEMKALLFVVLAFVACSGQAGYVKPPPMEKAKTYTVTEVDCQGYGLIAQGAAEAAKQGADKATVINSLLQPKNLGREGYRAMLSEFLKVVDYVYSTDSEKDPVKVGDMYYKQCVGNTNWKITYY